MAFIGLGVTQVIDQIAMGVMDVIGAKSPMSLTVLSLTGTLTVAAIYVLFGYYEIRYRTWAFVAGIVLYGLDALVFLLLRDYLPLVFHTLALTFLARGPGIIKKLRHFDESENVE